MHKKRSLSFTHFLGNIHNGDWGQRKWWRQHFSVACICGSLHSHQLLAVSASGCTLCAFGSTHCGWLLAGQRAVNGYGPVVIVDETGLCTEPQQASEDSCRYNSSHNRRCECSVKTLGEQWQNICFYFSCSLCQKLYWPLFRCSVLFIQTVRETSVAIKK